MIFQQFYKKFILDFKKEYEGGVVKTLPLSFYGPIHYTLNNPGKQIRPALLCAVYSALSAGKISKAIPAAKGIEMIHNFTLIHDDIMDGDDIRHGHSTVNAKWNDNIAILAGDGLFAIALQQFEAYCDQPELFSKIMPEVLNAVIVVSEGQAEDLEFEDRDDVRLEEYLEMVSKKTAKLLSVSAKIGALLAGADDGICLLIEKIIHELGIVFQIQDDLLELTADEALMGKSLGSDLVKRKKTFPFLYAKELLDANQWNYFLDIIDSNHIENNGILPAKEFLKDNLIFDKIYKLIKLRHASIQEMINGLPAESQETFTSIVEFVMNRKY